MVLGEKDSPLECEFRIILTAEAPILSFVSAGVQALLGYSEEDFLSGKIALQKLIHAHDQDISEILLSPVVTDRDGDFNIRIRQANGRIRCIKGHYRKEITSEGVVLDLLLQDAKSLRRTMTDAATMLNFEAMMENTDDYIYFKDRNHVFTGASQTLVSLCHPSEHWTDLIGQTSYDVFPEEYADIYYKLERQVFAGIPVASEIQETITKSGKKGWVDNRKYPIRDKSGKVIGLFGIARDITERKEAEEHLRESEEKLRAIFEMADVGIAITDKNGQFFMFNTWWSHHLGYKREELMALKNVDVTHLGDLAETNARFFDLVEGRIERYRLEKRFVKKDGSFFWGDLSVSAIKDENHRITHVIGMVVDVTRRKQVEEQVRQMAFFDPMTQLPNRRLLNDRLGMAKALSKRKSCFGAVLFIDIDNFKSLNDMHGHGVGDLLLIEVANRLKKCVRDVDTVARFGGDEFVVVIGELGADEIEARRHATIVAERVGGSLSATYRLMARQEGKADSFTEHHSSASIGVVLFDGHDASQDEIIKWADEAMYQAKREGRNRIQFGRH